MHVYVVEGFVYIPSLLHMLRVSYGLGDNALTKVTINALCYMEGWNESLLPRSW